jgi:hypothetical protein
MRFADFLRTTVLSSAAGASVLIVATLAGVKSNGNQSVIWISLGWWVLAALIGLWLGRGAAVSESIRSLLASARTQSSLPELTAARTLINRLWPLMLCTVVGAFFALLIPQVPAVGVGFLIIWAFTWRQQASAVKAIEDRDGARFYIDHTMAWQPIKLVRTPGFRATLVEMNGAGRQSAPGGV